MVKILTDYDAARLAFSIEKFIREGFVVQGGISTCVNLANDMKYSVLMVKKGG